MAIAHTVKPARSKAVLAALLASLAIFVAGAVLGYSSISHRWAAESLSQGNGAAGAGPGGSPVAILVRNLGAIMLLYSGAVTLGVTSVLGLAMVSAYVGATMSVAVSNAGAWQVLGGSGGYAAIEFSACILAATAGLYPVFAATGRIFATEVRTHAVGAYLEAVGTSLRIFGCAAVLVLVAATIESIVIVSR